MYTNSNYFPGMSSYPDTAGYSLDAAGDVAGGLTDQGGVGRRQPPSQTVVPVPIQQLINYSEESGPLEVWGLPVGLVKIIGQVKKIVNEENRFIYTLEDNTAAIRALKYKETQVGHGSELSEVSQGQFVSVVGSLRSRDEKSIQIIRLAALVDRHEYSAHLLEIALIPLRMARIQHLRRTLVQTRLTGSSFSYPAVTSQAARGGPAGLKTVARGIIPAKSKPFTVPRAVSFGQSCQMADEFVYPEARIILNAIRSVTSEYGATTEDLMLRSKLPEAMVRAGLEYLVQEGHIYCTLDENHFKSTYP